jgi:hypothetical protein
MKSCHACFGTGILLCLTAFSQPSHNVDKTQFERWMKELSNWGRWGKDDQKGSVNLITPAKVKQAAASVKEGISVSLEHPVLTTRAPDNSDPLVHTMTATSQNPVLGAYAMDRYEISFHGYGHTHMDALGHAFRDGKMYNGYTQGEVTSAGAGKNDIAVFRNGIVTRGVLIDIPRLKGVPYLEPKAAIYVEDLEPGRKGPELGWGVGMRCLCGQAAGHGGRPRGRGTPEKSWLGCTRRQCLGLRNVISQFWQGMGPVMFCLPRFRVSHSLFTS